MDLILDDLISLIDALFLEFFLIELVAVALDLFIEFPVSLDSLFAASRENKHAHKKADHSQYFSSHYVLLYQ